MDEPLTFGSLFAGIGGFDLGLERAGMVCKWQVEIDDYATRILEKHWPNVRRWDDIKTFPPDANGNPLRHESRRRNGEGRTSTAKPEYNGEDWEVDLICGGFPCQDISCAGRGSGLDGERSGLFFEAVRVVRQLRPRYVLLENVAALLARGLDRVHGELAEIGYSSESHCIPAASVGAPHIRDRVFVVGYSNCSNSSGDDLSRQQGKARFKAGRLQATFVIANTGIARLEKREGEDAGREGAICGTKPVGGEWWSVEPDVGRVANGVPKRVDRLRGLGNAVVPQVAQWIGEKIVKEAQN